MHEHRCAVHKRGVAAFLILASAVAEETAAESLPDLDCIAPTTDDGEAMALEDVRELISHVLYSSHCFGLYEVFGRPRCAAIISSPGIVNVQESKVVAVLIIESCFGLVRLLLSIPGSMKYTILVRTYHADNGEHLFRTACRGRNDQTFRQCRVHGEVGHSST